MKRIVLCAAMAVPLLTGLSSCIGERGTWSDDELALIVQESALVRVLQVTDPDDLAVLRSRSSDIPRSLIGGEIWRKLEEHLLATVQNDADPGVGIAGPQIGLSRRVVAVQRFDKEGEPFGIYPNIRITAARGNRELGHEGCLSVPGSGGEVLRWQDIDISYTSTETLADTSETVKGFTAVIFQHECDHLDGILFTDRIKAQEEPETSEMKKFREY